jgi:hypothetical protein
MADPLSVTASIITVLDLAAKVTSYLKDVKGGAEERLRLRDELRNTVTLLHMLKDRAEDVEYQGTWAPSIQSLGSLDGPLDQFRKILESLVDRLASAGKIRSIAQALKWPFDKEHIIVTLNALERQKSLFALALQNDHITLSQEIKNEMHQVSALISEVRIEQKHQNRYSRDQDERELLAWISSLDFRAKQNDTLDQRQAGTGLWLLETDPFKRWLSGEERTLWCPGYPGAGKTVFASAIIDYLEQTVATPDIGIAFVYCDYKDKAEQTNVSLIASLLRQLVEQCPDIPGDLRKSYKQYNQRKIRLKSQEYAKLLRSVVASFSRAFIVIDALDECDEINGSRSRLISDMNSLPSSTQLLCTSRFLPDLERQFESCPRIEIRASEGDVKTYLISRIEQESRLSRHVASDPSLKGKIVSTIVRKVEGM